MHLSHLFIAACALPQTAALVGIRPSPATRRSAAASEDAAEAATSIAAVAVAAGKSDDDAKIKAIAGPALLGTLADPLLSVVDTAWVSRLGTTAMRISMSGGRCCAAARTSPSRRPGRARLRPCAPLRPSLRRP